MRNVLFVTCLILLVAGVAFAGGPTKVSNAQSAMYQDTTQAQYIIEGELVWSFDAAGAAKYFDTWFTGPVRTCSGNITNCADANAPAAPTTAPDARSLTPVISSNTCTFFNGGVLSIPPGQDAYTQSVTLPGLNGKGNFTYTWSYTVAPNVTEVAQYTAWSSSLIGGGITFTPTGWFAGQSTQLKGSDFKASHTITDASGIRVSNPLITITNTDLNFAWSSAMTINGVETAQNYVYTANGGNWGDTGQLFSNGDTVNAIQDGVVYANNNALKDNFAGNNGTGGERALATADAPCTIAAPGLYQVNVTAVLKGNSAFASSNVNVTSNVCVRNASCTVSNACE